MIQSKIITQELKTVEKHRIIFDIESVTTEHSNTVMKFSKFIKNQKLLFNCQK